MQDNTNRTGSIIVSREVLDGIEAVRESGLTNMLDRHAVQKIANDLGYFDAVVWIEDNPKLFAEGLFRGFKAEEPSLPE